MSKHPRRRWRRRLVAPLAVLAVVGGGWTAYAETAAGSHHYRTAAATVGDVSATLELSGTVSASGKADLISAASGKVVAVPVAVGRHVRRGQVIARLDQTSLIAQVKSARASLAKASAQLASDEDAQTSSITTTSTSSTTSSTGSSSTSTSATSARSSARRTAARTATGSGGTSTVLATIKKDQAAVTKAQTTASTALTTASNALATEETACADPASTASSTRTSAASASTTDSTSATASPSSSSQVSAECQSALGAVQSAQAAVSDAQAELKTSLDTLSTDLATALAATGSSSAPTGSTGSQSGGMPSGASGSGQSGATGSTASIGTSVTAATLARDQASIDQAKADLISAVTARRAAVVRAPSAGQIRSLSVAKGDQVSTGADVAIIVGKGLTTVEISATQAQAAELKVGGTARVKPAGSTTALTGRVSRIAHVPTSSSTASTDSSTSSSYAVEVTLAGKGVAQPPLGMPVAVSAIIGTATDVVTVPASAVSNGSVDVLKDGKVTPTRITTGVIGASSIQVLSGVSAGDQVVLADLDKDLPSSDSSTNRSGFGGANSFGGGAMAGPPGMGD